MTLEYLLWEKPRSVNLAAPAGPPACVRRAGGTGTLRAQLAGLPAARQAGNAGWLQREKHVPMLEAELQTFGRTHAQIGAEVANCWNLSPELQSVIEFHHDPLKAGQYTGLATLVRFAADYSESLGAGFRTEIDTADVFNSAE